MFTDYEIAKKDGDRAYRRAILSGSYPYLPALDSMVREIEKYPERNIGIMEIPLDMIAGTRTVGRQNAFARNFMPLMEEKSEFAQQMIEAERRSDIEAILSAPLDGREEALRAASTFLPYWFQNPLRSAGCSLSQAAPDSSLPEGAFVGGKGGFHG